MVEEFEEADKRKLIRRRSKLRSRRKQPKTLTEFEKMFKLYSSQKEFERYMFDSSRAVSTKRLKNNFELN